MRHRVYRNPTTVALGPEKAPVVRHVDGPVRSDGGTVRATPDVRKGAARSIGESDRDLPRPDFHEKDRAVGQRDRSFGKGKTHGQLVHRVWSNRRGHRSPSTVSMSTSMLACGPGK